METVKCPVCRLMIRVDPNRSPNACMSSKCPMKPKPKEASQ